MKIFLSSRYSRRDEMGVLRARLERRGHIVVTRWLDTMWRETDDSGSAAAPPAYRAEYAVKDLEDVAAAECLIAFTEPPRSSSRGGRHVEMGAALALGRRVIVVGWRENLFCWHPSVEFFDNVDQMLTVAFPHHSPEQP